MIGCPAHGRVVERGPAEARIPDPAAGGVGGPARRHAGGHPHAAVGLHGAPAPVLVERFRSVDSSRDLLRAGGLGEVVAALVVPAIPRGQGGRRRGLDTRRLPAGDDPLLIRRDGGGGTPKPRPYPPAPPIGPEPGPVPPDPR